MAFCFNKDRAKFDEFLQFVEDKKNDKGAVMPVLLWSLINIAAKFTALHRFTVNSLLNLEESILYASV